MVTTKEKKSALERAVSRTLRAAKLERDRTGEFYTEEALRYIALTKISKEGVFGKFPNAKGANPILVMEYNYDRHKRSKKKNQRPDIASIYVDVDVDMDGNKYWQPKKKNPLVIELKIDTSSGKVNEDIYKVEEYIDETQGDIYFELGAVIVGTPLYYDMPVRVNKNDSKILFGYLDEKYKVVTYWI